MSLLFDFFDEEHTEGSAYNGPMPGDQQEQEGGGGGGRNDLYLFFDKEDIGWRNASSFVRVSAIETEFTVPLGSAMPQGTRKNPNRHGDFTIPGTSIIILRTCKSH